MMLRRFDMFCPILESLLSHIKDICNSLSNHKNKDRSQPYDIALQKPYNGKNHLSKIGKPGTAKIFTNFIGIFYSSVFSAKTHA
jgi:hypothetical protein